MIDQLIFSSVVETQIQIGRRQRRNRCWDRQRRRQDEKQIWRTARASRNRREEQSVLRKGETGLSFIKLNFFISLLFNDIYLPRNEAKYFWRRRSLLLNTAMMRNKWVKTKVCILIYRANLTLFHLKNMHVAPTYSARWSLSNQVVQVSLR